MGQLFRFLFSTVPQWVQLAGILIGVPAAIIIAWKLWTHRRRVWAWWLRRTRLVKIALASTLLVVGAAALGSGLYGYNYVMHENDFCQACHIMDTAWNRFQVSAHKNIQCHDCHRQPLYVSTKELFWWVLERRMTVPAHDKVPNAVCAECHMRAGTDSSRTLVTLTAGHALHLQSTKPALKDVQCVSCHGRDFHRFKPTNFGCAQSGCHMNIRVNLGAMSQKGFLHCTSCHDFKGRVAAGATVREAKLALVPDAKNCFSCHAMSDEIKRFDLAADPHKGNCGICHDVHKQSAPKDAYKSCATAQCHASADTLTAFHRGLGKHTIDRCAACHQAHSWKVKGTDCLACHQDINLPGRPAARRVSVLPPAPAPVHLAAYAPPAARIGRHAPRVSVRFARHAEPLPRPAPVAATPADTAFPHARHKNIACTTCHATTDSHGGLRFSRPAGCTACHHAAGQRAPCAACHAESSRTTREVPVSFAISARPAAVSRPVSFAHARHASLACARCHANDLRRSVTTTCTGCHASHHTPDANCASCHPTARAGHDRLAHEGCASCHRDSTVAALPATRAVCLACHQEQRAHYPAGDCATCHALAGDGPLAARHAGAAR